MKVIYIAGPFRASSIFVDGAQDMFQVQRNTMDAMELALAVWRTGYAVALCPHANTMFFTGAALDRVWLDGDLELLRRCDAILLTASWEQSSGARAERDFALAHNIPVFYELFALNAWLEHAA